MVSVCVKCQQPFKPKSLALHQPPVCDRCRKQEGRPINERVSFDDRAEPDAPLKERELRECN